MLNVALAIVVAALGITGSVHLWNSNWIGGFGVIFVALFVAMLAKAIAT